MINETNKYESMLKVKRKINETKQNFFFLVDKNEAPGPVFDLIACFYFGFQYKMPIELNFVDIFAEIGQRIKK